MAHVVPAPASSHVSGLPQSKPPLDGGGSARIKKKNWYDPADLCPSIRPPNIDPPPPQTASSSVVDKPSPPTPPSPDLETDKPEYGMETCYYPPSLKPLSIKTYRSALSALNTCTPFTDANGSSSGSNYISPPSPELRANEYYTEELECVVDAVNASLFDEKEYGTRGGGKGHTLHNVRFDPRGCVWDANVVANDRADGGGAVSFDDSCAFSIRIVASATTESLDAFPTKSDSVITEGDKEDEDSEEGEAKASTPENTEEEDNDKEEEEEPMPTLKSKMGRSSFGAPMPTRGAPSRNQVSGSPSAAPPKDDNDEDEEPIPTLKSRGGRSSFGTPMPSKGAPSRSLVRGSPSAAPPSGKRDLSSASASSATTAHDQPAPSKVIERVSTYVLDILLMPPPDHPTRGTPPVPLEDLSPNQQEKDRQSKKLFEEICLVVRKDLVKIEFPEFPEGCKGRAFRDVYQLNARLKSGSFATVCRGTHRATGKKVAIKCVLRKDLPPNDDAAIYDEVAILASLRHRYVCPLIDFFEEKECYFLVMELMAGGDLFDRVGRKKAYNEKDARDLCRKMLEAMQYCHSNGIAHCDMKPKNLLLKSEDDDSYIKLADFGFAARVHSPKTLTKQCGTPFFVAPEILMRVPYDQASDLWSVGCIVYLLLGGNLPFLGRSQRELFRKIVVGKYEFPDEYWSDVSEDAKDLVRRLLVTDPDKRLTAAEALSHKWIRANSRMLAKHNLMFTSQRLKTFNARMKLRSSMIAVNWVSSMSRMSWIKRSENDVNAGGAGDGGTAAGVGSTSGGLMGAVLALKKQELQKQESISEEQSSTGSSAAPAGGLAAAALTVEKQRGVAEENKSTAPSMPTAVDASPSLPASAPAPASDVDELEREYTS